MKWVNWAVKVWPTLHATPAVPQLWMPTAQCPVSCVVKPSMGQHQITLERTAGILCVTSRDITQNICVGPTVPLQECLIVLWFMDQHQSLSDYHQFPIYTEFTINNLIWFIAQ